MVAKFQEGGGVNDYESEAYGVGSSVSSTAASEDIGTVDEDRGPGDPPASGDQDPYEEEPGIDPLAPTPEPDSEEPVDTGAGDSVVSTFTTEQLEKAVDAIEKAKYPSAVEQDMLANMRAELSARAAIRSGLLEDEALSVTEAARQISPIEYLADVSTPMVSGAFVDSSGRGVMADVPGVADIAASRGQPGAINYTNEELAAQQAADGGPPERAPAVDADDMVGIGAVAPRSAVQAPPSGGIAGAINYTDKEIADQQAADGGPPERAPAVDADGIAEVEPEFQQARTPDELDEIQDFEDMAAAQQAATVDLQDKKAGLAGLGVLAGSPALAAGPFARDMFKTLANPDVKAGELLAGEGLGRNQTAQEVVNEKGERVGVVVSDPDGVVSVQPTSFENSFDPALRDAYNKMNKREQEERERGSEDNQELATLDDPEVEEAAGPQKPPTIDIIPFRPQDFYYFTPGSFAYNRGLPSMMNMREG